MIDGILGLGHGSEFPPSVEMNMDIAVALELPVAWTGLRDKQVYDVAVGRMMEMIRSFASRRCYAVLFEEHRDTVNIRDMDPCM